MIFILAFHILIYSNVTQVYYIPFQAVYTSILLLYIIEVPWAEVSTGREK